MLNLNWLHNGCIHLPTQKKANQDAHQAVSKRIRETSSSRKKGPEESLLEGISLKIESDTKVDRACGIISTVAAQDTMVGFTSEYFCSTVCFLVH